MTQSLLRSFAEAEEEETLVSVTDINEPREVVFITELAQQQVETEKDEPEEVEVNPQKAILDGFKKLIKEANLNADNFEDFCFNINLTAEITNIIGEEKVEELNLTLNKKMAYHRIFRSLVKKHLKLPQSELVEAHA